MGYQNGDAGITHCILCKAQFEEIQKFGDIISCENCEQTYQINIKK
jgi:DNA-directed RNA polymerase subunit RPC12/RpoP